MTWPASSLIGEMVSDTRMRWPSLAHPHGLEVFDPLPGLQGGDDLVLFGDAVRRNDQGDVTPDGLLGRVAEQPLGGGVPALDDAVQRLADDGVVRRLDDRRQQAGVQKLFRLFVRVAPLRRQRHPQRVAPVARTFAARIASPIPMIRPHVKRYAIIPTTSAKPPNTRVPRGGMKRYEHAR